MTEETKHYKNMTMNICLSYGSRSEIVNACKSIASDVENGKLDVGNITEALFHQRLLTGSYPDPDVLIRTSGEMRLSNFLLWQSAYSEFFFVNKPWPALTKIDLISVIQSYANGRTRRFGK